MAGIYFHIPFCQTRCIYCDFFSSTNKEKKEEYVKAMCREVHNRKDYLQGEKIETIYFGGGTPSQLSAKDFETLFSVIASVAKQSIEITLEANPDDITPAYLNAIKHLPFNRISLGIQSFDDDELTFLNRRHDSQSVIRSVELCRDFGFDNISIDLMYGLPDQSMDIWERNLNQAIALDIQHVSAYHLIYEEGTRLYQLLKQEMITPVDEELSIRFFEVLIDTLSDAGFEPYEISNFAKPGYRSLHNSSYWNGTHYLGIGASAHSYNGTSRQWNVSSIEKYIAQKTPVQNLEIIDEKTAYNDFILTRLRTMEGIHLPEIFSFFGEEKRIYCLKQAQRYLQNEWLEIKDEYLKLTRKGIFVSDGIMSALMK